MDTAASEGNCSACVHVCRSADDFRILEDADASKEFEDEVWKDTGIHPSRASALHSGGHSYRLV